MLSIGIDIGYSSVKLSLLEDEKIIYSCYRLHHGRGLECLAECLKEMETGCDSLDSLKMIGAGAVTGSGSRIISENGFGEFINETAAAIEGGLHIEKSAGSIIEIGGEGSRYISGFAAGNNSGIEVSMNSNCSAGTGSFLEEQVSRLNLNLEDYSKYALEATAVPRIAGRCSVFAKTDITHHQQEGESVNNILMGLAYAVVKNYKGTIIKRRELVKPVVFAGGVGLNQGIITAISDVLKLESDELIVPELCGNISATGTALLAGRNNYAIDLSSLIKFLESHDSFCDESPSELQSLYPFGSGYGSFKHKINYVAGIGDNIGCFMGIDIGSTSTNVVLTNTENEIIAFKYVRTHGNPIEALRKCFSEIVFEWGDRLKVTGVGVTGSGRYMIGKAVGADIIRDEITAQAAAAVFIDPDVDTIFEIGGQDSKFIMLEDGRVRDFQMNKVCAAGTGSFIEEQAKKFSIPINDFGLVALKGKQPTDLGERCTVFIESSIASHISRGASIEDIAAGLCYSIVKNYLNRVVGAKTIGRKIFLQGGIAYNQGVVNAFRSLTGKEIIVPPFFSVTGAYGAAILASNEKKAVSSDVKSAFKGFEISAENYRDKTSAEKQIKYNKEFNERCSAIVFNGYDGKLFAERKTVGIPRALFTFGMYPLFSTIFHELGFNVLLSEPTNERTIELGQEFSQDDLCYPMKLINGHVAELIEKKVDYIFFPDLHTVDHPGSASRQNYGCAYMQLAFKIINQNMNLASRGIKLLAPTIAFNKGKEFMMKSFASLGAALDRSPEQTGAALQKGMKAALDFEERMEENSHRVCESIKPNDKVIVLISKIYGVADPVLNMGIPGKLMELGFKVLSFFELPEGDISAEHPNMYWPFGQHILEPAKLIKEHPNMYAVFLTHHCCGPDSVFLHYFRDIMQNKPYLNIEVDEHSSGVGVITRIEAFANSIKPLPILPSKPVNDIIKDIPSGKPEIITSQKALPSDRALYLPNLYPYSDILASILGRHGIRTFVLPLTVALSVSEGRKHILTNELLSLTALLGDVFIKLKDAPKALFFIPQFEGAEVDGQYARLTRAKMDEAGFLEASVFAPFAEDFPLMEKALASDLFYGIIAGDIIRNASPSLRAKLLSELVVDVEGAMDLLDIVYGLAREAAVACNNWDFEKCLLATGEAFILYNDYLNEQTFSVIEKSHRVIYSPLSEALLLLWKDRLEAGGAGFISENYFSAVTTLEQNLCNIALLMGQNGPFSRDFAELSKVADWNVGYYAGAFGRYRCAASLREDEHIDGVISVCSTYENTGITLNTLHKGFSTSSSKPFLNLMFDGVYSENNMKKTESFLFYL
ncbi:MAG: acyl-CoA dehydratase activase [Spirochaetales bacterium]|nr:acyl-CoA dehydratase activase [Spirochaetales bacterium]